MSCAGQLNCRSTRQTEYDKKKKKKIGKENDAAGRSSVFGIFWGSGSIEVCSRGRWAVTVTVASEGRVGSGRCTPPSPPHSKVERRGGCDRPRRRRRHPKRVGEAGRCTASECRRLLITSADRLRF